MSKHYYPTATIYGDYARAAFGFGLTATPLLLLDLASAIAALFATLAALFGWFGWRTALRQISRIEVSPEAIALRGPLEREIPWDELRRVKLAYYAPRRGRRDGWLQLTLRGTGRPIRIDSHLIDFDQILRSVQSQVREHDLPVDPTTALNFGELGFAIDQSPGALHRRATAGSSSAGSTPAQRSPIA